MGLFAKIWHNIRRHSANLIKKKKRKRRRKRRIHNLLADDVPSITIFEKSEKFRG
jgi:hypothetical protein